MMHLMRRHHSTFLRPAFSCITLMLTAAFLPLVGAAVARAQDQPVAEIQPVTADSRAPEKTASTATATVESPAPVAAPAAAAGPAVTTAAARPAVTDSSTANASATSPSAPSSAGQESPAGNPDRRYILNFEKANWTTVLEWLADEAQLSLMIRQAPIGTFTLVDNNRKYTLPEVMDELNMGLLDTGFAIIRRGRQLLVYSVDNIELIDQLAREVTEEELENLAGSDIVSVTFPLGALDEGDAEQEVRKVLGKIGTVNVLGSIRQVSVTSTAQRLRRVKALIDNASRLYSEVTMIRVKNVLADDVMALVVPLMDLDPDTYSKDELKVTISLVGDAIVAVGSQAERMRLENLIKGMDVPSEEVSDDADAAEAPYIKMYSSSTLDLTTLDAVLQTQLSGRPDARIRINEESKSIIIKGRPETHQEVEAVIKELDGVREEFRKFKLNRKTPQEVALAINRLFGGTEEAPAGPLVDGDP
ncbi:MAG: hypothetical protein AAFN70_03930, partial [Planctomycetota bacterium]